MEEIKEEGKCCICGKTYHHYGNNPAPLKDKGRCCDECNRHVVLARLGVSKKETAE